MYLFGVYRGKNNVKDPAYPVLLLYESITVTVILYKKQNKERKKRKIERKNYLKGTFFIKQTNPCYILAYNKNNILGISVSFVFIAYLLETLLSALTSWQRVIESLESHEFIIGR